MAATDENKSISAASRMMARYRAMWRQHLPALQQGNVLVDPALDAPAADQRRGLSLIIRPSREVCERIDAANQILARGEAGVWTYIPEQLHVTALTLIGCRDRFRACDLDLQPLRDALSVSLRAIEPFEIRFRGVTATNQAIMAQGFADDSIATALRAAISGGCSVSRLAASMNERYDHVTVHCTMQRFRAPLVAPADYCQKLMQYRAAEFGQCLVRRLILVENDWFHRPDSVLPLAELPLGGA